MDNGNYKNSLFIDSYEIGGIVVTVEASFEFKYEAEPTTFQEQGYENINFVEIDTLFIYTDESEEELNDLYPQLLEHDFILTDDKAQLETFGESEMNKLHNFIEDKVNKGEFDYEYSDPTNEPDQHSLIESRAYYEH